MHLKRYRMPTVRDALARVRDELGPDALVLSTRLVAKRGVAGWFGGREVEITAAADRRSVSESRPDPEPEAAAAAKLSPIVARLTAAGIEASLAREVESAVPWIGRRAPSIPTLRRALAACLASMAAGDEEHAAIQVFIGPPGAGKTTTIAKIAAQERALRGQRVALVAADGYRVGAVEQLRLYADIIGTPFSVARSAADVERALAAPRTCPVLVDTAGRSPRDAGARETFSLLAGREGVRVHLVLPADTTAQGLDRTLDAFAMARPDRVVITRTDEADSVSPLVNALREHRLPISFLGTGQRVPEDLERATPAVLAACLLGEGLGQGEAA